MKRLLAAFVSLLAAGCGGVEVRGLVKDEQTGAPLKGATVQVGDESTRTDESGSYSVRVDEDTPPDRIKVDMPGYAPSTETVTIDRSTDAVKRDFELQPANDAGAPVSRQAQPDKPQDLRASPRQTD